MNVTEDRINLWAKAISDTEEEKCNNAIRVISEALREHFGSQVTIIHQGSHRNRTNIRADSDVDIAVVYNGIYFSDVTALPPIHQQTHWNGLVTPTYTFEQFKKDVHDTLVAKFGLLSTIRKNKCIRVEGNTYRVSADVVPAFESRQFRTQGIVAHQGIGFLSDSGGDLHHSFPEQHYQSGVSKNDATSNAYKAAVRVLKNARNEMEEKDIIAKDSMRSFFLECLVWNVPNEYFQYPSYREDARAAAAVVWKHMKETETPKNYTEVSGLKWLLREAHRTPAQAEDFMYKVWHYLAP